MAQELAFRGAVGVEERPAPQRKGVLVRRGAFAVRREVFAVAKMSAPDRRLLRERLDYELDAVRGAIRKAELLYGGGSGAAAAAPPAAGKDGRLLAAGAAAAAEEGGGRAAKKRKVPPFVEQGTGEPKRARTGDRERLAGRLAALAAALPDHAVAFLQNRRVGGADSLGDGGGEVEKDVRSMKGGGALFQLKMLLDKFAPASAPKKSHGRGAPPDIAPGSHGRALPLVASGSASSLSRHQGACGGLKIATMQEEEEEDVDICGGVSRIAIRDIAEEYGELVEGVGVKLLSPLQRKYVDLAEQGGDEYVDICGDASPVVFPAAKGKAAGDGRSTTSPSFSSSYGDSDASSSDSDSSSRSSDTGSESDPGKNFTSRPPQPIVTSAQPPEPAAEAVRTENIIAEPAVQDQRAPPVPAVLRITSSPPAPAFLPHKVNGTNAPPPSLAPEMMQIAEQEELQVQPAPMVRPAALPKENDTNTQPPEPPVPSEAVKCVAPAATAHPITGGGAPPVPTILLPEESGASSYQPVLSPPPVAPQVAEPEELHVQDAVAAPAPIASNDNVSDLVTAAKEEAERRRQLAKERAKAKARRALLEMERAALPDERVHPRDMELLGIAAFEHVASTVQRQGARAAAAVAPLPVMNDGGRGGGLRVSPGNPSVLQQLGVFLKADDGSDDEDEEEEKHQQAAAAALASRARGDDEVEDGEIR
ncbi:unnamed protein product [Urochloa humidicola]